MNEVKIKHSFSPDGLILSSSASNGKHTYTERIVWDNHETAERNKDQTMRAFDESAPGKLQGESESQGIRSVRQSGKRVVTPWGDYFTGYSLGGDFDRLLFPRVKIHRVGRKGISVGWFKAVLFFRQIRAS